MVGRVVELGTTSPLTAVIVASGSACVSLAAYWLYRNDDERPVSKATRAVFAACALTLLCCTSIAIFRSPAPSVEDTSDDQSTVSLIKTAPVVEADGIPTKSLKFGGAATSLDTTDGVAYASIDTPWVEKNGVKFAISECGSPKAEQASQRNKYEACDPSAGASFCKGLGYFGSNGGGAFAPLDNELPRYYSVSSSIRKSSILGEQSSVYQLLICVVSAPDKQTSAPGGQ